MKQIVDAGTIRRLGMALALLVLLPLPALAATIHVDGDCSLAEAIHMANTGDQAVRPTPGTGTPTPTPPTCEESDDDADIIVLMRSVNYSDETHERRITSDITVQGGHIRGEEDARIKFIVSSPGSLTFQNVNFTNAKPSGGEFGEVFVWVSGDVTFQNVQFYNSGPSDDNDSGLSLNVSSVPGNSNVKISESIFKDNRLSSATLWSVLSVEAGSAADIYRSAFYNNGGSGDGYVIRGNATIRSSTIGLNRGDDFAVSGGRLNNVTVAYNNSGGVTGATSIRNSILYQNSGGDCSGATLVGYNWVGDGGCTGGTRTYTGPSPDIDDDWTNGLFPLEADGDAAGKGEGCEFIDQWGQPYGPDPCDLGAQSTYKPGSGPRISAPVPTGIPTPTRVPDQPTPTIEPVKGWVLFSDRDDILSNEVDARGVGIAHIIEQGFLTALDIWSEVGWGVTACHTDYSNGNFEFLDAAGMPRVAVPWPAAPHIDGMACTYIETPGTVVLMRADAWQEPATPTPDPNAPVFGPATPVPLEDCQLITRDMVNLRAEEWGDVLNIIPYETELTASEAGDEFFKVSFEGQEGWVHRDWVFITAGVCGAAEEE